MNRSILFFAWMLTALLLLSIHSVGQTNPAAMINGRWEADGVPSGPWTFDLSADGKMVAGRITQHGGVPGPSEIYSGVLEGDVVTFKTRNPITPLKEITFSGRVSASEIVFDRSVEIQLNSANDGTLPAERGVFGTQGPTKITARRVGPVPVPAVAPRAFDSSRPIDISGKWESLRWNLDVWIFDLKSAENQLTGTVAMTAGPGRQRQVNPLPQQIFDAKVDGNTVSFKSKSPDNVRTITFTGKIQDDEIAFTRVIEVPPGGATGFEAVYGAFAPFSFLVKRVSSSTSPQSDVERELQKARMTWAERPFMNYEFTAQWRCLCPMPTLPLTYRVTGNTGAAGVTPTLAGLTGLPPDAVQPILERYATFDQMFVFLSAAAARRPYLLKIEYDPVFGYPSSVILHPGGTSVDDDLEFRITGFRVVN